MSRGIIEICPRCNESKELLALCRRDNKTMICNACGTIEALEDMNKIHKYTEEPYWDTTKR